VHQSIALVQHRKRVLVPVHEPLLHALLLDGEQETQQPVVLGRQHGDAVVLRDVPDAAAGKQARRQHGRHAVKGVVDDPVEHLDQEGEALEDAAVDVVAEARRVGQGELGAAPPAHLGRVLCGCRRRRAVVVCVRVAVWVGEEGVRGAPRVAVEVPELVLGRRRRRLEDAEVAPAGQGHGAEEDGCYHLGALVVLRGEGGLFAAQTHERLSPAGELPRRLAAPLGVVCHDVGRTAVVVEVGGVEGSVSCDSRRESRTGSRCARGD
jgi:hypothetical protein